jgi:hypothetical protein
MAATFRSGDVRVKVLALAYDFDELAQTAEKVELLQRQEDHEQD